jgi:hypothetical protein
MAQYREDNIRHSLLLFVSEARSDVLVTNIAPAAMTSASRQDDFIIFLVLVVVLFVLILKTHCRMRRRLTMGCYPTTHL